MIGLGKMFAAEERPARQGRGVRGREHMMPRGIDEGRLVLGEVAPEEQDELTEKEADYFRRGKNSNPHAVSKNATHADYMYATGFEALLGYLFLNNEEPRMEYLIYKSFDICDGVIKKAPAAEIEAETEAEEKE